MASLSLAFGGAAAALTNRRRRVLAATAATKNVGSSGKEKGLLDFILGGLQKEDQLLETDPILNKADDNGSVKSSSRGTTRLISIPSNKSKPDGNGGGVFGGLFAKK